MCLEPTEISATELFAKEPLTTRVKYASANSENAMKISWETSITWFKELLMW